LSLNLTYKASYVNLNPNANYHNSSGLSCPNSSLKYYNFGLNPMPLANKMFRLGIPRSPDLADIYS